MGRKKGRQRRRPPIIERTRSWGVVDLKFPGFEAKFPGTNRSVMVMLCSIVAATALVILISVPVTILILMRAPEENVRTLTEVLSGKPEEHRQPVEVPIQTDDGIEIIEVCPPCERQDCDCPTPICPTPICPRCSTEIKVAPATP